VIKALSEIPEETMEKDVEKLWMEVLA